MTRNAISAQTGQNHKRGSYKSKIIQARVFAKRLAGKSIHRISKEEHITRETVARILSQPEYEQLMRETHDEIIALLPQCVAVLSEELRKRKPERVRVALEILHGKQILVNREDRELHSRGTNLSELSTEQLYEVAGAVAARIQELIKLERSAR